MSFRKFLFQFNRFSLKDRRTYYVVSLSESFLVAALISRLLGLDDQNTLLVIGITLLMTPPGIAFAGGYRKIRERFAERHKLPEQDFR